jgi:hypothetical protein
LAQYRVALGNGFREMACWTAFRDERFLLFDKTLWFWRWIESLLPWRGLSLIVIAVKR